MLNGTHFRKSKTRVHIFRHPDGFWKWNDYAAFHGPERAALLNWIRKMNEPKDPDLIVRWTSTETGMPKSQGWCLIKIDLGDSDEHGISIMNSWYDGKGFSRGSTSEQGKYVENVYGWVMMSRMRPEWNGWEQMTKQTWKEK